MSDFTQARVNSGIDAAIVIDDIPQGMTYELVHRVEFADRVLRITHADVLGGEAWALEVPTADGHVTYATARKSDLLDMVCRFYDF